jgi:phosphatidylglycerol:prolipoprotein diacylglycerol transferase
MRPILFDWGPIVIHTYGFFVALAVLAALVLMRQAAPREGWSREDASDFVLGAALSGFLGARILYVLQHATYYTGSPLEIFRIWEGGLVFYGGLVGGLLFVGVFARRKRCPYWQATDFLMPYGLLAHAVGRIGCFLNGCCYGLPARLPWAVSYPFLPHPVHPVQLYEALFNLASFLFLSSYHRRKRFHGETTLAYFVLYGTGRFFLERYRGDNPLFLAELTLPQILSVLVVASTALVYFAYFRKHAAREDGV